MSATTQEIPRVEAGASTEVPPADKPTRARPNWSIVSETQARLEAAQDVIADHESALAEARAIAAELVTENQGLRRVVAVHAGRAKWRPWIAGCIFFGGALVDAAIRAFL